MTALHQIINDSSAKCYQDLYIKWLTEFTSKQVKAPSTDPPQPSTSDTKLKQRSAKERRRNPLPSEPGYDWRSFQKSCKVNEERKRAQTKLLRENQKEHRRLQRKRERQCYEPTEDWTEDLWEPATWVNAATQADLPTGEAPTAIVVVEDKPTQTSRYSATVETQTKRCSATVATQTTEGIPSRTATTQTVGIKSKITRATQTEGAPHSDSTSVSVFHSQRERFEYWSHRREELNRELSVAKQEIEEMLSDLMTQMDALIQPKT